MDAVNGRSTTLTDGLKVDVSVDGVRVGKVAPVDTEINADAATKVLDSLDRHNLGKPVRVGDVYSPCPYRCQPTVQRREGERVSAKRTAYRFPAHQPAEGGRTAIRHTL